MSEQNLKMNALVTRKTQQANGNYTFHRSNRFHFNWNEFLQMATHFVAHNCCKSIAALAEFHILQPIVLIYVHVRPQQHCVIVYTLRK
jgi:hypothetical protein